MKNLDQTIRSGYAVAFLLLLVSYGLLIYASSQNKERIDLVAHTNIVINKLDNLLGVVREAEAGFRGYLLITDPEFLRPYYSVKNTFDAEYDTLKKLTEDNKPQADKLKTLQQFAHQRFTIMDNGMAMYKRYGYMVNDSVKLFVYRGKEVMNRMSTLIKDMQETETKLLTSRQQYLDEINRFIRTIAFISLLLAFILICYSVITFTRENRARKRADSKAVTYSRELEERIKELNNQNTELVELRSIEKFSSTGRIARVMAHEIKNPLNNINLATEQLKETVNTDNENIDLLDIISRNAGRINLLITNLLNSTRFSELNYEKILADALIDEVIDMAKDRIQFANVKVIKQYGNDTCYLMVDKERIKIAFLNIIVNSIEAIEKQPGFLKIKTERMANRCIITITDNGKGMHEETLSKVFEPFFTDKPKGTGLGLTNTQNIILNHKGTINVKSKLGEGTVFIIVLNVVNE